MDFLLLLPWLFTPLPIDSTRGPFCCSDGKPEKGFFAVPESPAASPVRKRHNNQSSEGPTSGRTEGGAGSHRTKPLMFYVSPKSFSFRFSFFVLASSCPSYIIDAGIRRRGPRMQPASPGLPHLAILPSGAVDTTYKHLMCHRHCQLEDRERGKITGKRNIM